MEHEGDGEGNCDWCTWDRRIGKGTGWLVNKRTSRDHPNYRIIKIGQNTEKSPRDLRRLAVTQIPLRNQQLTLVWNIKAIIVPIVIGAFGIITKGLLKGLEDLEEGGRVETIQMTALLKTARILRRVLETWGDLLSLKLLMWETVKE